MTVREIRAQYPETAAVFERFGFRSACDDCALETVALRQGVSLLDVVDALNVAILKGEAPSI